MKQRIHLKKVIFTAGILSFAQIAALAALLVYGIFFREDFFSGQNGFTLLFLLFLTPAALFNGLNLLGSLRLMTHGEAGESSLLDTIANIEKLNKTLRGQRHDFMNHLQVVYGLMELGEYKEAQSYIEKTYTDIQKVSRVLKTASPAVNAMLAAKLLACEKRGIAALLRVSSPLASLQIPEWELCKVLGNLIDNAMYALKDTPGDKRLAIEIYEDLKSYTFRISDNGVPVPEELKEKIFEAGFTTKGKDGEGMGLAIVKETAEEYGGTITCESDAAETSFAVSIPKG